MRAEAALAGGTYSEAVTTRELIDAQPKKPPLG